MARKRMESKKEQCGVPRCTKQASCCGMCHNHYTIAKANDRTGKRPFSYYVDKGWARHPHTKGLLAAAEFEADEIESSLRHRRGSCRGCDLKKSGI